MSIALNIDVWFDYACPFSYLQQAILQKFVEIYGKRVEVSWNPFDTFEALGALAIPADSFFDRDWDRLIVPLADEIGVEINRPPRVARTQLAFNATFYAHAVGQFDAFHKAVFCAYFVEGRDIGSNDVLRQIAFEVGLDLPGFDLAMRSNEYIEVAAMHSELVQRLGVRGLPYLVLSRLEGRPEIRPVELRGAAPLRHLHVAVKRLFPEGFSPKKASTRRRAQPNTSRMRPLADKVQDDLPQLEVESAS